MTSQDAVPTQGLPIGGVTAFPIWPVGAGGGECCSYFLLGSLLLPSASPKGVQRLTALGTDSQVSQNYISS